MLDVVEQTEKMSTRFKQLKRQLDETEEECARITALKRKTQRELEEKSEHCEVLTHEIEQLKGRLRGASADKQRSSILNAFAAFYCLRNL